MKRIPVSVFTFLLLLACVDRLYYDISQPIKGNAIFIDGLISDQPGPYKVNIFYAFDSESKTNTKAPASVKQVIIFDNEIAQENLTAVMPGVYQTDPNGMRGTPGHIYKLRVELNDGRIYESIPDTLINGGALKSIEANFSKKVTMRGTDDNGFDIIANAKVEKNEAAHYMWTMTGTYKSLTHPELMDLSKSKCNPLPLPGGRCNYYPICTGLQIVYVGSTFYHERVAPCSCCTCWYTIYSDQVILSDGLFTSSENINNIVIDRIPINGWIFYNKIHIRVDQKRLSENAFKFWKAVSDQKAALNSLFQPITGKIPLSFAQLAGKPTDAEGIFFATSLSSKSLYIERGDVPPFIAIPRTEGIRGIGEVSCLELFPDATNAKPSFWED